MGSYAGGGGNWVPSGMGSNNFSDLNRRRRRRRNSGKSRASSSGEIAAGGTGYRFPVKQAATAASLCFTGDTTAQLRQRWVKHKDNLPDNPLDVAATLLSEHEWIRALRMTSFSFLLHGPGSYAWYQFLDRLMPIKSTKTFLIKVILTQILLGPTVTASAFTWNNLWLGRASQLPEILKNEAIPAQIFGYKFWIPVSALNFWLIPLEFRVAFMCTGGIFWNFYLSSTLNKVKPADKIKDVITLPNSEAGNQAGG